jgi:hypothetical protein
VFFPVGANSLTAEAVAKTFCETCPVRSICLADALLRGHAYDVGVRGGLTAAERHELTVAQREALIQHADTVPGSED